MSKCIVIVGATGTGKTTTVVNLLNEVNMPLVIFDVNNEEKYKPFKNLWDKNFDFESFINRACELKGTCIVFEEATIFFSHSGATTNIKKLLVQKRHTKNLLIFNFHSLRQVPLFILDFCDLLVLGKTVDNRKNIETKFKNFTEIYEAFNQAQAHTDKYVKKYVRLIQQ
jgi:Cdc6-like AAA superfamily ATPase